MPRPISLALMTFAVLFGFPFRSLAAVVPLAQIQSGDLVRGTALPAVYYVGKDGFRYVFPNDKTYFTWYENFDGVKWISDADLASIQIGGNVTYKPSSRMVKINSDPRVYAVDAGGSLRWVTGESVAVSMYGTAWNAMIDDVPDAFFGNYRMGADIETALDFDPAEVAASIDDINDDKNLKAATVLNVSDNFYDNASVTIKAGTAVRWYNTGANKHTATATDLSWGTGTIQPGGNFGRYFHAPGTYRYFCSYHPTMSAAVVVE
jgi:plastocyanin